MTVAVTDPYSGPFLGNGATTAFPFLFAAKSTSEVAVYVDGFAVTTGFTITLNADSNGGTVTFTTAPASGVVILIASDPSFEQDVAFTNGGTFLPESHDEALDRGAIRDIALKGQIARAPLVPVGETIGPLPPRADRPGMYEAWDADGNPVAASGTGADAGLRTDLAADTGFSLIKYKSSQSGSYGRSAASWARLGGDDDSNVFHHIDPDLDASILDRSVTDDIQPFLQNALNQGGVKRMPSGLYTLASPLASIADLVLDGGGRGTVLKSTSATNPRVFEVTGESNFAIRNMKLTPGSSGGSQRAGIYLVQCVNPELRRIWVEDHTDASGIYAFDCDSLVVDNLYFDGGSDGKHGAGFYGSGCKGGKVSNSTAINCFSGFSWSGYDIDFDINPLGVAARPSSEAFGSQIDRSYVRYCTTQAFNINGCVGNGISNSAAEDYAGSSTHKAFQVKDSSGDATRCNTLTNNRAKNYPTGIGAQQSSHTIIDGFTGINLSINGVELNSVTAAKVKNIDLYEVSQSAIWMGGGTVRCNIDGVSLETSTATCKMVMLTGSGGNDSSNNLDNLITNSTLAAFIDNQSATNSNNRFGPGCRPGGNPVLDLSTTTQYPVTIYTPPVLLNATSKNYFPKLKGGIKAVRATLHITTAITGTVQVSVGRDGATGQIAAPQTVAGAALTDVPLTLTGTAATVDTNGYPTWSVTTAGTGGAAFVQVSGFVAV